MGLVDFVDAIPGSTHRGAATRSRASRDGVPKRSLGTKRIPECGNVLILILILFDSPSKLIGMDHFIYRNRSLYCEDVPSPTWPRSTARRCTSTARRRCCTICSSCKRPSPRSQPLICYSIKTNGNLHIARLMVEDGAGCDVTSGGELYRALQAGLPRRQDRLRRRRQDRCRDAQALENNVFLFNVESEGELSRPRPRWPSRWKACANVALRVNPDLPPKTHVKTDTSVKGVKFGLDIDTVLEFAQQVVGTRTFASSDCTCTSARRSYRVEPYRQGIEKGLVLIEKLREQGHPNRVSRTWAAASASTTASRKPCRPVPSPRSSCPA